jgi:hypothetical protein
MKLTKLQLKLLRLFYLFRADIPSVSQLLAFNWAAWLPLLAYALFGFLLTSIPEFGPLGWWAVGMGMGAFLRDIGRYRDTGRAWPLYQEIINWEKVSALMEANQKPGS